MSRIRCTRSVALAATLSTALALTTTPAAAQVEVSAAPLPAPDLWSTPGRDTGLPADLWSGASADLARAVLPTLGEKPISPALRRLAIRVLATGAAAPEGGADDAPLAAERALALTRLGAPDAALAVLSRTPRVETSEPLSRARAEAGLYLGRDREACETERALQTGRGGGFWLKLRTFCQLQAGEAAAAQVTFDLWRQTGERAPAFTAGMAGALSGGAWKPVLGDAITTALSRRTGTPLATAVATATPAATVVLARDTDAAENLRAAAAERAHALGLLSVDEAARLATPPVAASASDLHDAGEREPRGPRSEATLFETARNPPTAAAARAEAALVPSPAPTASTALLLALDAAADAGRLGETALLALHIASRPDRELSEADNALIVRALARAGLEPGTVMVRGPARP